MTVPLSILDLAPIRAGDTAADSFAGSVALARLAENAGYRRIWYAEHHNMASIASSATSVLIAHIAANTSTIRLGSGGIMLPNHAPLTIAEQFGTLAALHPGRIDLGLGRAPGSDQNTMFALRREATSSDRFPQDVLELQGYLGTQTRVPGVYATPGRASDVPLYILGSSLFGAQLAAALGLPFAFASHFSPAALTEAVALYRAGFQPSDQLDQPYVIAGVNVIAADTAAQAQEQLLEAKRFRVRVLIGRGRELSGEQVDAILTSAEGQRIDQMMSYSAVGVPREVRDYLTEFRAHADADELIVAHQSPSTPGRLRSTELLAQAMSLQPPTSQTGAAA